MRAALAAAVLFAGWCATGGSAVADPALTPTPAPSPAPQSAPKTVIDADGTYTVGTDIVPGTYQTAGPVEGKVCYFKRVRGDEVLDSVLTKKPQVVEIEPTDTVFKTDRCQPWQQAQCPPTCAPSTNQRPGLPDVLKGFFPQPRPETPAPAPAPAPGAGLGGGPAPGPAGG